MNGATLAALRSNDYIIPAYQRVIDGFVKAGGDASIPETILGVKKEYLDAAFDQMEKKYGSIEKYFTSSRSAELPPGYWEKLQGTAERCITLAGYRIADIILAAADQIEAQRKFMGR